MKIIFTSCMDAERMPSQPVWTEIAARAPDVLLLLGDQIYMDWGDRGESKLKQQLHKKHGLEIFAREMHRRYELQWSVEQFQSCIRSHRAKNKALYLCWDDHDFAWNNSFRQGVEDEKHAVPLSVMHVSKRLFQQYEAHLQNNFNETEYPDLPNDWASPLPENEPGIEQSSTFKIGTKTVPFMKLDTRWYRTSRAKIPRTLLGETSTQKKQLMQLAQQPHGLLIVAGGTPMRHDYLLADDGWSSKSKVDLNYPEYKELLSTAKRPVLYLSGDIHRNAFGGTLNWRATDTSTPVNSQVIQLLSSGAAIGGIGTVKYQPSLGQIEIEHSTENTGKVSPSLLTLSNDSWVESLKSPVLHFEASGWKEVYQGENAGDPAYIIDALPLSTVTMREREKPFKHEAGDSVIRETLEAFDQGDMAIFKDTLRTDNQPEAAFVSPAISAKDAPQIAISRPLAGSATDKMRRVMEAAFDAAQLNGKRSVVFFIHGLGKSHAQAIEQAYAIRVLYPDCEPIAFTWPAGESGSGPFSALAQYTTAQMNTVAVAQGLTSALSMFSEVGANYPRLKKIILARSAGSIALHHAVYSGNIDAIKHINTLVLSAPLLKVSDFEHRSSVFKNAQCPVWVTFNSKDNILRRADWANLKIGEILGVSPPKGNVLAHIKFVDFSKATSVNRLHDYMFTSIKRAAAVHAALLTGENPVPSLLEHNHWVKTARADTFEVQ